MADDWRTPTFRQSVVSKIEEAIRQSGQATSRNSHEMENHVFQKAKTKEEYLGFVARLILHVREMNSNRNIEEARFGRDFVDLSIVAPRPIAPIPPIAPLPTIIPLTSRQGYMEIPRTRRRRKLVNIYNLEEYAKRKSNQILSLQLQQEKEKLLQEQLKTRQEELKRSQEEIKLNIESEKLKKEKLEVEFQKLEILLNRRDLTNI